MGDRGMDLVFSSSNSGPQIAQSFWDDGAYNYVFLLSAAYTSKSFSAANAKTVLMLSRDTTLA